jgi:hypothetical protein
MMLADIRPVNLAPGKFEFRELLGREVSRHYAYAAVAVAAAFLARLALAPLMQEQAL